MSNKTSWLIVLMLFAWNLSVASTNEMGVWDNEIEYTEVDSDSINAGITDLTNTDDLASNDDVSVDFLQIPFLVIKSFILIVTCFAMIPLTGLLLAYYGVPVAIAAIFEAFNLLMLAVAYSEFASNRSATR